MKYGPRGRGLGTRFSFRWNNKVARITVCEPLNAGLPPKKHVYATSHIPRAAHARLKHRHTESGSVRICNRYLEGTRSGAAEDDFENFACCPSAGRGLHKGLGEGGSSVSL